MMVNFKLGDNVIKMKYSTWHERVTKEKIWVPDGDYELARALRSILPD